MTGVGWCAWHSLKWEAKGRAWPVLRTHGDEGSLLRKAKPPGLRLHFQGAQTVPSSALPTSLPSSNPDLIADLPRPSQWGQVGAESLTGLCPAQCTQLQSLSEPVAPSQPNGNQLLWKLGTLSQVQRASLSYLPEAGASSVVPLCSDAPLRTRLRTVSRWEHFQIHV